eukprot:GHVQ01004649.1.p1 GENE.GHVQ01004649.1~~GHVQ01004649.1.p1  ORF type:complete len:208 (+),score=26.13 GHVQ01004649.1:208-831(+)
MCKEVTMETPENKISRPFVGFVRLGLVDGDGLGKHLKGCAIEGPIHMSKTDDHVVLTSHFSKSDPVHFLRLGFDDTELLTGRWCIGSHRKADEHLNPNKTICYLETVTCKKLNTELNEQEGGTGILKCSVVIPFLTDPYDRTAEVLVYTHDYKLTTRIFKVEVKIPQKNYEEWEQYYDAIKEFEKAEKKDKDDDKKDDKKDKGKSDS